MPASRVGLIGCGRWGRLILRDLLAQDVSVTVVDLNPASCAWALDAGATAAVAAARDLPAVDALIVATPASIHAATVTLLLDRGVPILVEKPLTTDLVSAERLAAQGAGRLFLGHVWRYHPGIEMLGQIARSGELGPVMALRSVRANWTSPQTDSDSVWNLLPHDLTLAIEILGGIAEPRAAVAELHGQRAVGMNALLGDVPLQAIEVSNRYADKRREVRLHCRDGVAVMTSPDAGHIELHLGNVGSREARVTTRAWRGETALMRQLRAFVGHVAGGPPPKSDAAEGVAVVKAVLALRRLAGIPDAGVERG